MPRRKKGQPPPLLHHKGSNQGYIIVAGRFLYLGRFGTPECRRRYWAELQRWEEEQGEEQAVRGRTFYLGRGSTVKELVEAFLKEVAGVKYRIDGEATSTLKNCHVYLGVLVEQYGDCLADEFRHLEFEDFRRQFVRKGFSRNSIKTITTRIMVLFRWGHRQGAISPETLTSLTASPEAHEGEERDPIEPVPREILQTLIAFLQVRPPPAHLKGRLLAMLQVQDLVGMRPGELVRMKGSEIRKDATVLMKGKTVQIVNEEEKPYQGWVFQPSRHKNLKRGRYLAYLIGPKARAILEPWLPEDPEAYLWEGRVAGTSLTYQAYRRAIKGACELAGVPAFAPNQLRHGTATRYSQIAGLDKASQVLSHASLNTTAIYASRGLQAVVGLVEKYG